MDSLLIRMTRDGRGRGLFTTVDVKKNDMVFEESAMATGHPHGIPTSSFDGEAMLVENMMKLCKESPAACVKVQTLRGGMFENAVPSIANLLSDKFTCYFYTSGQINDICSTNNYMTIIEKTIPGHAVPIGWEVPAVWLVSSFINDGKAEDWNVYKKIDVVDSIPVRIRWFALCDIAKGSELITTYGLKEGKDDRYNITGWSPHDHERAAARAYALKCEDGIEL